MSNVKYIFKKLRTMKYKNLYHIAKEIGNKINKPVFLIVFDMAKCAFKYGSGYTDYYELEFYLLNDRERATYITSKVNSDIVRKYNKKEDFYKLNDRVEFAQLFKTHLYRDSLDLRSASFKEFKEFISGKNRIVGKSLYLSDGKDVDVIDIDNGKIKNEYNVLKIYNALKKNEQYLVYNYIEQHDSFLKIYKDSVNILRVVSFLDDNGKVHILSILLKNLNGDNVGDFYTFLDDSGKVMFPLMDEKGNSFERHPVSNFKIKGFIVPNYDKVKPFIEKNAKMVPDIRYVGWDIMITKKDVVLIDGNYFPRVFQVKPSIGGIKKGDLSKYKKYMDI